MPAAPRKESYWLEVNRRPPSLVEEVGAVTAGQGGVAVTAGRRAPQCPCAAVAAYSAVAAPGPRPWGSQWRDPRLMEDIGASETTSKSARHPFAG